MNSRDKKRQRKMQDLQYLTQMLGLAEQFGPRKQLEEQLLGEQVQAALQQRLAMQQMHPLQMQMQRAQIGAAEDARKYESQFMPGRLAEQQYKNSMLQREAQFAQDSYNDKVAGIRAEVKGRELQNQQLQAVLPHVGQAAFLDNAIKQHQSGMMPVQKQALQLENDARRAAMQQEAELHPFKVQGSIMNQAAEMQRMGMMNQTAFDPFSYMRKQGLAVPMPAQQQGDSLSAFDRMMHSGLINDLTAPGGKTWLAQNLPAAVTAASSPDNAGRLGQLHLNTQALLELQRNPVPYGLTEFNPRHLTPEMLLQAQKAVRDRLNLNK